jgi:hypothetical protein
VGASKIVREVAVVVLGVLVALAADSAVELRRERSSAYDALDAIRRDVAADVEQLEYRLEAQSDRGVEARAALEEFLIGGVALTDSIQFLRDVHRVSFYQTFDPNTTASEALIADGRISLIENREVREAILSYRRQVQDLANLEAETRPIVLELQASLVPRIVAGLVWSAHWDELAEGGDSDKLRQAAAVALNGPAIRDSGALRELLVATAWPSRLQAGEYHRLLEEAGALHGVLDELLGGP